MDAHSLAPEERAPQISIVIPAHNAESTIDRALTSCLAQTDIHVEVVVVENASNDGTLERLRRWDDERIRVLTTTQAGRSNARNLGISQAAGEYLMFLDADDEIFGSGLAQMVRDAIQARADFVQGAIEYRDIHGRSTLVPAVTGDLASLLYVRNYIAISSSIIRKSKSARFPEGVEYCEDWRYWVDSIAGGARIAKIRSDHLVSRIHTHDMNTSSNVGLMRSYGLSIYSDEPPRLRLIDSLKRRALVGHAIVSYAAENPILYVDRAICERRLWRISVNALRRCGSSHIVRLVNQGLDRRRK